MATNPLAQRWLYDSHPFKLGVRGILYKARALARILTQTSRKDKGQEVCKLNSSIPTPTTLGHQKVALGLLHVLSRCIYY